MVLGKTGLVAWIIAVLSAVCSFDDATRELVTQHVDAILFGISGLIVIIRKFTDSPVADGILGWLGFKEKAQ